MMKSIVVALVTMIVAVGAGCRGEGQAQSVQSVAATTACARLMTLCQGNGQDRRECERTMSDVRPGVDAENVARTARCMGEARTCGEATGCMAGSAARAGANFLRDFTNGFTR
jgi:hypothetical protein